MTKTLTEQWREGTIECGLYYVRIAYRNDITIAHTIEEDLNVEEVLAPVPSYESLYNPNDGRIPVGLFTILKIIKRDIERTQEYRDLTDLECGIKSQVVSLLKRWGWDLGKDGLVSKTDESSRKALQLEEELKNETISNDLLCEQIKKQDSQLKDMACENDTLCMENGRLQERLAIATKALKDIKVYSQRDWDEYNCMECADKALKEMEGVK